MRFVDVEVATLVRFSSHDLLLFGSSSAAFSLRSGSASSLAASCCLHSNLSSDPAAKSRGSRSLRRLRWRRHLRWPTETRNAFSSRCSSNSEREAKVRTEQVVEHHGNGDAPDRSFGFVNSAHEIPHESGLDQPSLKSAQVCVVTVKNCVSLLPCRHVPRRL